MIAATAPAWAPAWAWAGAGAHAGEVAVAGATPPERITAGLADVIVTVTGLRSHEGVVRACMTADPADFPDCRHEATSLKLVTPASQTVRLVFTGVAPGRYAIALLHDENSNGRMDRALMMMPKEGFGFSRDAPVVMGPPKFEKAAFEVGKARNSQAIKVRYMLGARFSSARANSSGTT